MIIEPKIYMDANAIIDAIKHNQFVITPKVEGVKLEDRPYFIQDFIHKKQHVEYCSKLLKAAEYNELTILTYSLSVAEVWHLGKNKKNPKQPTEEEKRVIMSVLSSGKIIKLVTDSIFVAERARDLSWKYGIELSGADAIHVASALEANCIEFITNDKGILDQKEKIKKLGLNVINAQQTSGLPANFHHPLYDSSSDSENEELDEVLNETEFFEEGEPEEESTEIEPESQEVTTQTAEAENAQEDEKYDTNK